jgi:hypothetical protein
MADNETLSFRAINVFIERDFLQSKLEEILEARDELPKEEQIAFNNQFRKFVSVLGFRNPLRAPRQLQVNAYASAFEEKDEVVPFTLSTWTKLNQDFAEQVKDWLNSEGWEDLSLERSFESSDGFRDNWPEGVTFEKLSKKFHKDLPDVEFETNDLILMILWISDKLPPEQSEI